MAPRPRLIADKQAIDLDTLRAVVTGKFHIMADFGRTVIAPVLREELQKADHSFRELLQHHRTLLVREEARMDEQERHRLAGLLESSQALRTVHESRARLLELWNLTTANHDKLLRTLQEWCAQAEESGIQSLQDFARYLRGYSLHPQPA